MINNSPVFLLASERSGTNLLRKLVTEHQNLYFGPSPAHFLKHLFYREPYYGDLNIDDNFKKMITDALDLCYIHFSPWGIKLETEEVLQSFTKENFPIRNSIYLSHLLMTLYARSQGYSTYFCKDNNLFQFVFEILYFLPDAKFIYLHRDPRDVVVSQLERKLQTDSVVQIAELWKKEQIKCISAFQKLNEKNVFKLSYEDLIANPEGMIKKVCAFLEIKFLQETRRVEISTGNSQEWKNLDKPVMKNNSNKFLKKLSKKQIAIIEFILINQMKFLGYSAISNSNFKLTRLSKKCELVFGFIKSRLKMRLNRIRSDESAWYLKRSQLIKRLKID